MWAGVFASVAAMVINIGSIAVAAVEDLLIWFGHNSTPVSMFSPISLVLHIVVLVGLNLEALTRDVENGGCV